MSTLLPNTYDELPYSSEVMFYAQPECMATLATLFGMQPPPVKNCRVLELGCADGINMIATASSYPEADCWGIDLSAQQIANGYEIIHALGLKNITLKQMDILEVGEQLGKFDYIIAHGIFSWVGREIQEKILQIYQQLLVENGVAYLSYNTKPGWNMRTTIRDLMLYHTANLDSTLKRAEQMKPILKFLVDANAERKDAYSLFLQSEFRLLGEQADAYLYHEFLEYENQPFYFYEVMQRVHHYELVYLGDAFISTMFPHDFSRETQQTFNKIPTFMQREQYLDFLRNRHFRHSLLCRQGIPLQRGLLPEVVEHFYVSSSLKAVDSEEIQQSVEFRNARGSIRVVNAVSQMALRYLGEQFPKAFRLEAILDHLQQQLRQPVTLEQQEDIKKILLEGYLFGLIEFRTMPPALTIIPSDYPVASPLARWQVKRGKRVSNLYCEGVQMDELASRLLPYLDGTRHRTQLLELINQWFKLGTLRLNLGSSQTGELLGLSPENFLLYELNNVLETVLESLAKSALLTA